MPQYGEIIMNVTGIRVATLNADNTYTTPAYVEYGGDISFEVEMANNELSAYGMIVESLAVAQKVTGNFVDGTFNFDVLAAMLGAGTFNAESESGTTPDRYRVANLLMGGAGNGYFGMIASLAAKDGANVLVGVPKAMLETVPGIAVAQNEFRTTDVGFNAYAPSTSIRRALKIKRNETAEAVPATANDFGAFFAGMFA